MAYVALQIIIRITDIKKLPANNTVLTSAYNLIQY